jgi:hypothetical protein
VNNRSPILSLSWDKDFQHKGIDWVCEYALREFYEIPKKCRHILIARKHPDPGYSYSCVLGNPQYIAIFHEAGEPETRILYRSFWAWLLTQAQEGRQHIGVLILLEEEGA